MISIKSEPPPVSEFLQAAFGIEASAALLERRHRDPGAEPELSGVGRERPGEQSDERRLAGAIGANNADAVAAHDASREILNDDSIAIGLADLHRFDDERARSLRLARLELHLPFGADALAALGAQLMQLREALDVALAPAGDAMPQPMLLGDDATVGLVPQALFLLKLAVAPRLELLEAGGESARAAAVEPDGLARKILQKSAVVADEHERRAQALELLLEPEDGRQIEMVCRLVEQQHVGARGEGARQSCTPRLAARKARGVFVAREAEFSEQQTSGMRIVERTEARLDEVGCRREAREVRLLREIAQRYARLQKALAAIEIELARGDPEQRRLSRAVAPDEAQPRAGQNR